MKVMAIVLRYYSIAFSVILSLFMTGVATVLLLSGSSNYKFEMLPFWKGPSALYGLLVLGLFGVAASILALLKKAQPLLVVFTLALAGVIIYGFFMSPVYRFRGEAEAKSILWLAVGAAIAFLCSFAQFSKPRRA